MIEEELAVVRRVYAKQVLAAANRDEPRLEVAFATRKFSGTRVLDDVVVPVRRR
jgi:hypothetical protein